MPCCIVASGLSTTTIFFQITTKTISYSGKKKLLNKEIRDMSYSRMTMIYPGESSSVSQGESAPEGDPGCFGKMEWKKT
jgi:hypothetical protein